MPELKDKIVIILRQGEPVSKKDLVARLGDVKPASVGYHLTRMRRAGEADLVKGKWLIPAKKVKKTEAKVAAPAPKKPSSIKLLLLVAQDALSEAFERIEELEKAIGGD